MARFVNDNFLAARVHPRENGAAFKTYSERYQAPWTPTTLELDAQGVEQHRIEGFLPADDFLAQLMLGRARMAFQAQQWDEAERRFREVVERFPDSDAAPEALYWAGVAPYKKTGDPGSLGATGRAFQERYQTTPWAKKASVWR